MPITRLHKRTGYTSCSNEHVHQSKTLSYPARGMLGYLLSHGEGWKFHKSKIIDDGNLNKNGKHLTGREAVDTILVELKDAGHLQISQVRCEDGSFDGWQWDVWEEPQVVDNRKRENRLSVQPTSVNPQLQIKKCIENKEIQTPLPPAGEPVCVSFSKRRKPITASGLPQRLENILQAEGFGIDTMQWLAERQQLIRRVADSKSFSAGRDINKVFVAFGCLYDNFPESVDEKGLKRLEECLSGWRGYLPSAPDDKRASWRRLGLEGWLQNRVWMSIGVAKREETPEEFDRRRRAYEKERGL